MSKNVIELIDLPLLQKAAPGTKASLKDWLDPIQDACVKYEIDTVREVACFLAQASHESSGFYHLTESMSYSAKRLMQVWPKRFPNLAIANQYAMAPEKLANFTYANRMGNGPAASGDGWRFRGRGLFQLTGRNNYTDWARAQGISANRAAEYIDTKEGAAMSAAWFFDDRGIDRLAATPGVEDETRAINGGIIGLPERKKHFDSIVAELVRRGA